MQKHIYILLFLFLSAHLFAQPGVTPINQEPGKCYAKCKLPDLYEEDEEIFKIYTQEANDEVELDSVYFSVNSDGDWVYEGLENELSFKQIQKKTGFEKIVFLVSDEDSADFVEETITYKRLMKQGAREWREVICGDKIDSDFFIRIQDALIEKGYLETAKPSSTTTLTKEIRAALYEYQRDNALPMGQLDMETLESFGL